ncbi:hypothetical protein HDU84_004790 [Entophlyctis sp. JEL0112]|nr:hypothetical protein HDU84_004790 [Entophlyctis sp. JEL0112]
MSASLAPPSVTCIFRLANAPANNDILCVDLDSFLDSVSVFGGPSALPFASPQSSGDDATAPLNSGKSWNRPQTSRSTSAGKYASSGQPPVSLDMVHDMQSSELVLTMQCDRVKSIARLKTLDIESTLDEIMELETQFAASDVACKLILKSIWLTHAMSELDDTTETIRIHVQESSPHLRISSRGMSGETVVEYSGGDVSFGTAAADFEALESVLCNCAEVSHELSCADA